MKQAVNKGKYPLLKFIRKILDKWKYPPLKFIDKIDFSIFIFGLLLIALFSNFKELLSSIILSIVLYFIF